MKLVYLEDFVHGSKKVVLNRPEKLNAFSLNLMKDFEDVLEELENLSQTFQVRAGIFCSTSPKAFCAGADLSERMGMNEKETSQVLVRQRRLMDRVEALPFPTVACIEGVAFGGGLELALACDFRFMTPQAQVGLTETRLAIIPGAGGTQRLPRCVGMARAKQMIYRAQRLSGSQAQEMGLADVCCDDLLKEAAFWLADIEQTGPLAQKAAKRALQEGATLPWKQALDWERECYQEVLVSEDRKEGLRAFSEKRKPVYRGG